MSTANLPVVFEKFNAGDVVGAQRLCDDILNEDPRNADALHLQGIMNMMTGKPAQAVAALQRAAEIKPNEPAIFENLGLAYLSARRAADAESALRKALGLGANHGLLHMRLGLAVGAQGRLQEAIVLLQTAAAKLPDDPDIRVNLGNALAESGRLDDAVGCYEKVLARYPAHTDTRFNLGSVYKRMGRLDDAERCLRDVLAQAPAYADAHISLGSIFAERGNLAEAVTCYRRALEHAPEHLPALNHLGNALVAQGQMAEAEVCFQRALARAPEDPDTCINLGNLRVEQGRMDDAQTLYEKALGSSADIDALRNLGKLFRRQGRYPEALTRFGRALERVPQSAVVMADLAGTYRDMGDIASAEMWYRKAMAIAPGDATTLQELGDTLKLGGRFDEAAHFYAAALKIKADCFAALGGLIYVRQQMSDWTGIEALWERARRDAIGRQGSGITPFSILAQPTTPAEQLACARAWAQSETASTGGQHAQPGFDFSKRKTRPDKLKVGYLSWDFHEHATAYLIAELFELHDRDRFEIFACSYGPDDGSAIRARMRKAVDGFVDLASHAHVSAAQAIHENRIDVLVDLKGYTQGARPQIMALRPAPVQVNWLGYPGTMGMAQIDAIIADPFIIPEGAEAGYSEQVVRLPDCYQINDRRRDISAVHPSRAECGLPQHGMVFCCFNQSYKILPDVFASWMRILNAVPESVLWLLETNTWAVENLGNAALAQGVARERLIFAPRRSLAEHLARYRTADLALDTFPYTSHTTASDALWAGCPLVTCAGNTFASRVAGSLLHAAGLPELVSASTAECETLTIELANSPGRLAALRSRLVANRDSCALFDTPRFVRNLERAYDGLWADWMVRS